MATELRLETPDGVELETELNDAHDAVAVAVLAHPHPQYGGTMSAPVIESLFERLPDAGIAALRFNFRGAGRSTGQHDDGEGERVDLATAAHAARRSYPDASLVAVGYSFGADIVLLTEVDREVDIAVSAQVLIAPPLHYTGETEPSAPTLILVPEHDQFSAPERTESRTRGWPSTELRVVNGTDHFLMGAIDEICSTVIEWLRAQSARPQA